MEELCRAQASIFQAFKLKHAVSKASAEPLPTRSRTSTTFKDLILSARSVLFRLILSPAAWSLDNTGTDTAVFPLFSDGY